jgi:hypothetical protein
MDKATEPSPRAAVIIDPPTGLPQLPPGQFWMVARYSVSIAAPP